MAYKRNPVGRPPKYKSVEEIQGKIDAYFTACKGHPLMNPDTGQFYSDDTIAFSTRELQVLKVGDLMGDGGQIVIIGVNIPNHVQNYEMFSEAMKQTEIVLMNKLISFTINPVVYEQQKDSK